MARLGLVGGLRARAADCPGQRRCVRVAMAHVVAVNEVDRAFLACTDRLVWVGSALIPQKEHEAAAVLYRPQHKHPIAVSAPVLPRGSEFGNPAGPKWRSHDGPIRSCLNQGRREKRRVT